MQTIGWIILLLLTLSSFPSAHDKQDKNEKRPLPPPMPRRQIASSADAPPGESIELTEGDYKFTLFIPKEYKAPENGEAILTVHFHTAAWFAIQEHLRRGLKSPLVNLYAGEGSSVYRKPFEDKERFRRWLQMVETELKKRGGSDKTKIAAVDISSFSAGYGAVRELIKYPDYFKLIRRIVLCDSMYASYEETAEEDEKRKPLAEHIDVWVPFAKAAAQGEKTFALTYSAIQTSSYASSGECAEALAKAVGAPMEKVEPKSLPAALDPEYPLISRADLGSFHVWGYGGNDAMAHMTHPRHLADIWMALDKAGAK